MIDDYRPQIEAALAYTGGGYTYEDVRKLVADGDAQFWYGHDSAVITHIVDEPQCRILYVFLVAGNLAEVQDMEPQVMAWGAAQGCIKARFAGRRGWERTFILDRGWTSERIVFEKDLRGYAP